MVASMKASQMRLVPSGLENPRVVSEEPLISNAFCQVRLAVPQNTKVKATTIRSIHTSGRLTRETGAYSPRSASARATLRQRCTSNRYTSAKTAWARRGKPSWGRTTVFSAEPKMVSTMKVPMSRERMYRTIMGRWARRRGGTPERYRVGRTGTARAGATRKPTAAGAAQEISRGLLHRLVDVLLVDPQLLGHLLLRLERRLLDVGLNCRLAHDHEGGLAGVDRFAELLDVGP